MRCCLLFVPAAGLWISLSLEGSLEHVSVMLLCVFVDSALIAVTNSSNCEKKMAVCVPWELALFGLGA